MTYNDYLKKKNYYTKNNIILYKNHTNNNANNYDYFWNFCYVLILYFLVFKFILCVFETCKIDNNILLYGYNNDSSSIYDIEINSPIVNSSIEINDINNNKICSICLEENNSEKSIKLNCTHVFHKECIKEWKKEVITNRELSLEFTCPICKTIIV
tara:strand:+ start:27 stop:494 length:468 start_codon:yes stop_codon:yes gene_type:complete